MKQWMINCVLFIICLTALGFSLMKITPFEIEEEKELSPQEKEMNKKFLDLISECCSLLIEEYVNVYDMKKEELKRLVIVRYE